nr:element excision factor XisH family protein [Calothrix sp. PCC 7507]
MYLTRLRNAISDFHTALEQFLNYQIALEENEPKRILYLAVPLDTYQTLHFFRHVLLKLQYKDIK